MLFWFIAALLTLGASLAVLLPLARAPGGARPGEHDLEVYRDQLREVERDAARGLIQPQEAEQARIEIARRIIRVGEADSPATMLPRGSSGRLMGGAAILAVPLISWGLYSALGSPDLPGQPLTERLAANPADNSVDELVARAEAHLAANPADGRGWDVLAPIYLRIGRAPEAVTAYENAIRLLGSTADRQAGLGEAIANAGGGIVTAAAQAAFEQALELEPRHPKALFFVAVGLAQEGRIADATTQWQAMLAGLPSDSPWREATEQALAQAAKQSDGARAKEPGPSQDDIDAAAALSPADRTQMIETMVAGLDEKLRQNPGDVEGWKRLTRSYLVLGKADAARDALSRGVLALGPASSEAAALTQFAATLGLSVTE